MKNRDNPIKLKCTGCGKSATLKKVFHPDDDKPAGYRSEKKPYCKKCHEELPKHED